MATHDVPEGSYLSTCFCGMLTWYGPAPSCVACAACGGIMTPGVTELPIPPSPHQWRVDTTVFPVRTECVECGAIRRQPEESP